MPDAKPKTVSREPPTAACDGAFQALRTYGLGSPRGGLVPIDEAVASSLRDPALASQLESRLIAELRAKPSAAAQEYICSKLALIGTKATVPALAALLGDLQVAAAARNALEHIPGAAPSAALRKALAEAQPPAKIGIAGSLGARRDTAAVGPLAQLLTGSGRDLSAAAADALGEIGSVKAARALGAAFGDAAAARKREMADAMLVCAERLEREGRAADAQALLKPLASAGLPAYLTRAAEHGLRRLAQPG